MGRRTGIGDQDAAVRLRTLEQAAGDVGFAADAQQRQGQMAPPVAVVVHAQHAFAHHAVGVDARVDEASPPRPGPAPDGQAHAARVVESVQHHGQHRAAVAAQAVGENRVVVRVDRVGFREDHVQAHRPRTLQAVEQGGMDGAAPGPAAQCVDGGVIDRDDQDVWRCRARRHDDRAVIQDLVDAAQPVQRAQQSRQRDQRRRQPQS